MKKIVLAAVFTALFGWAVFDLVSSQNETKEEFVVQSNEKAIVSGQDANMNTDYTNTGEVGLNEGNIAPDFTLTNLEGETMTLSDFRGQKVMINFWATWCPPCRAEMPDMQTFYEEKDIEILAVNLTQTESGTDVVDEFITDFELTFPILMDEELEVSLDYQIRPIPTSFMVDEEGVIRYKALGALNYDLMLQAYEGMN
ncbi:TlpA family protein disulfide reductase [Bacillaceae bacterium SIJ1]|uniref:peroxiredoxin family protein n=1 Tax=Litoribacterium kuwaitense TaxID=1398745 RepID=UPI0013ED680C|nr:TlpA disulfide reductase family protein [Litoribacterium kuwaitense]NGP45589.1 TlpA family protein disulfide reductase [Litoribacterium kuwaitense]